MNKRVAILGGGISGVGAAVLAKNNGYDVFLSDNSKITDSNKQILLNNKIDWEENNHTYDRILTADEVVKSPGITDKLDLIQQL